MTDDLELLGAWAGGDRERGHELVVRHFETVARFFRSKLSDGDAVSDLIQRSFTACLERCRAGGDIRSFRAYLLTVARNELIAHLRQREKMVVEPQVTTIASLGTSPSLLVARQEGHRMLLEAVRRIPLDLQIALELHYWEQMSMDDIGAVLGIPPGTVKSRLHRARELLRSEFEKVTASGLPTEETETRLADWARAVREVV